MSNIDSQKNRTLQSELWEDQAVPRECNTLFTETPEGALQGEGEGGGRRRSGEQEAR